MLASSSVAEIGGRERGERGEGREREREREGRNETKREEGGGGVETVSMKIKFITIKSFTTGTRVRAYAVVYVHV